MRFFFTLSTLIAGSLFAQQPPAAPADNSDAQASQTRGMPARATPNDYLAHGAAGPLSIGAEFMQHSVPSPAGLLVTEDYVVVEAGVFGPPGARTTLNPADFSLRINGKKTLQSEAYVAVFKSLKDPEWEPDVPVDKASKTSINSSGAGGKGADGGPPVVPKPPFKLQREWNLRMQKEAFPEGDRALPQAGLLFFKYGGKPSGIHSIELMYAGPSGKATLALQP
ncbi:MAG TPA: hypothetical protein VK752_23425 [Bryobacteraceae bacterium]|jgi:hypothetical protein|nr:hypothetical protein [Bryobacteraceae bacterium]